MDEHSMTNIEEGGAAAPAEGDKNGVATETDPKGNDVVNEPAGDTDPVGGEEAGEAGKDAGAPEGEAANAEGDPESGVAEQPFDPAAFKEDLIKEIQEKIAPPQAPQQLTEEQWAAKEQEFGVSRQAIQAFTQQNIKVYNAMREYVDAQFAAINKTTALQALSQEKGFTDAPRYRKEIDQFLSKFDPKVHSNPQLLKDAVIYARGLAASGNIQRARNDGERNRRIAGAARPSSPNANGGARKPAATPSLTREQRDAASKFGMSDAEYAGLMKKRGTPIAI